MIEERDPEECVSAVIEAHDKNSFMVRLGRADGEVVPICVKTTDSVIALVIEMNPPEIYLRIADGETRDAMLRAFGTKVDGSGPQLRRPTLH